MYYEDQRQKVTTVEIMRSYLERETKLCLGNEKAAIALDQIQWKEWVEDPGLPPVTLDFESKAPELNQARDFASRRISDPATPPTKEDLDNFKGWYNGL